MSETSRIIAFGVIALLFTIHGGDNDFSKRIVINDAVILNIAGLLAATSVISDYLQYLCGYFSAEASLKNSSGRYLYRRTSVAYKGRTLFFWIKQVFAFVAAILIVLAIASAMFGIEQADPQA